MARPGGKDRGLFERPKGSGVWWVRFTCKHGHDHREKVGPKGLAKEVYQERKVQVKRENYCPTQERSKPRPALFQDMAKEYLDWAKINKKSYKSCKSQMKPLEKVFKGKTMTEITPRMIESYKASRSVNLAPATVNRELALLRHMFTMGIQWGKAESNPVKEVKLFRESSGRTRYLSDDEEIRLFAVLPEKYQAVVALALQTGLRMGELKNLRWWDVDFKAGVITVLEAKAGETQHVPMNVIARKILESLSQKDTLVFPDLPRHLSERFTELARKAEVRDFTFHDLRHTFCSRLVMAGVDIRTVQVLARHKEIRMTLRYSHLSDDHTKQAIERLIPSETGTPTGTGHLKVL
jgi:integrase